MRFSAWRVVLLALVPACLLGCSLAEQTCAEDGTCSELDRERAYSHFLVGNDLYNGGDLEGAVAEYRKALEYDPQHADTLCNMGSALQDLGDVEESLELYLRAVDANPYHATAHFNLAILLHDDELDIAIEHYQAAIEADPTMADAWANLGSAMHHLQQYKEAVTSYQEAIELYEAEDGGTGLAAQQFLPALHFQLGTALSSLPDDACAGGTCSEHAVEQLRKALRLDPDNAMAQHSLGALLADSELAGASPEYVKRLFDDYAATFDESLAGLKYQAPELLREVVKEVEDRDVYPVLFDMGCGTGLCGPLFRSIAGKMIGVDLSPKMVEVARGREVYDELAVGDVIAEMDARAAGGERADMIIAADVLVYMGALDKLFESASRYCSENGLFAFTLEKLDDPCGYEDDEYSDEDGYDGGRRRSEGKGEAEAATADAAGQPAAAPGAAGGDGTPQSRDCKGWTVTKSGRFAHTRDYVLGLAAAAGFDVVRHEEISPRMEGGRPVWGSLFILRREAD